MTPEENLERLYQKHQELKKQYDLLSENIGCLSGDYHNETDSERRKSLERRRNERLSERDKIEKEMDQLEQQRERNFINIMFQELSMIDCEDHLKQFGNFIKQDNIGAFVIHGCGGYGLRFLLKRILENIYLKYKRESCIINGSDSFLKFNY